MSTIRPSRSGSAVVSPAAATNPWPRRLVAVLLLVSGVLSFGYSAICVYVATQLVYVPPLPITRTPADLGLRYRDVNFPARGDHVPLRGWFIPGVLPDGQFTSQRTLIAVHGTRQNRADPAAGLLDLSAALARHGFAVLAFDMRGMGQSAPAPISFGYFEQRDVLGAVDFLRAGPLPYPELGRPRAIAAYGVSMGGTTILLAAEHEPGIRAIVTDSAAADFAPVLEAQIPALSGLPALFTPGDLIASRALYGMDFYGVRPVDGMARLAPRPLLLIHGAADDLVPPANLSLLAAAARAAPDAHVATWLVPGARHAQAFHTVGDAYVTRLVAFYTQALGPDTSSPAG